MVNRPGKKVIAVWFSCGAASAVATKLTLEQNLQEDVRIINQPIAEEHKDNRRFLEDVEQWLGVKIEINRSSKYPNMSAQEVWEDRKYMCGVSGAPCTMILKKEARQEWENINKPDYHVLGFDITEKDRFERFVKTERSNVIAPLIDAGLSKFDCFDIIRNARIKPPEIYKMGYPNANCVGCVKSGSTTYWNKIRVDFPEVFEARAKLSREIGCKLINTGGNKRIFLDDLDPNSKGQKLKSMPDCGLFCEEWE